MATPFKRVFHQAAKQICTSPSHCCRRRTVVAQWQQHTTRPFSSTSTRAAQYQPQQSEDHAPITAFPESSDDASIDPAYEEDEISSLGHTELDQHRELREMIRLAAWEMPLLSQFAQRYTPPTPAERVFAWRYTTYMGEVHPAASKVVVEFKPSALKELNPEQKLKLRKLAGPRYNPETRVIKMSCESFETQAQNKRYLGDTIKKLIAEAKDPADSFADVPLDTRHHKPRKQLHFPKAWCLTKERLAELEEKRHAKLLEEGQKVENNLLVSGADAIETARQIKLQQVEEPVMAEARQPLAKGKMGKKEMGQTRSGR